jgi:hypothetical protein
MHTASLDVTAKGRCCWRWAEHPPFNTPPSFSHRTTSKKEKKAQGALSDDVLAQVAALEDDGEELDLSEQAGRQAVLPGAGK